MINPTFRIAYVAAEVIGSSFSAWVGGDKDPHVSFLPVALILTQS